MSRRGSNHGEVQVALPIKEFDESLYYTPHINIHLGRTHARTFHQLLNGLRDQNAKLLNGHGVDTPADVIRYLMEQIGDSGGISDGAPSVSKGRKGKCDDCGENSVQRTPEGKRYCFNCESWK